MRATNPSVQPVQTDEIVRAVGRCGAVPAGGGGEWQTASERMNFESANL